MFTVDNTVRTNIQYIPKDDPDPEKSRSPKGKKRSSCAACAAATKPATAATDNPNKSSDKYHRLTGCSLVTQVYNTNNCYIYQLLPGTGSCSPNKNSVYNPENLAQSS